MNYLLGLVNTDSLLKNFWSHSLRQPGVGVNEIEETQPGEKQLRDELSKIPYFMIPRRTASSTALIRELTLSLKNREAIWWSTVLSRTRSILQNMILGKKKIQPGKIAEANHAVPGMNGQIELGLGRS